MPTQPINKTPTQLGSSSQLAQQPQSCSNCHKYSSTVVDGLDVRGARKGLDCAVQRARDQLGGRAVTPGHASHSLGVAIQRLQGRRKEHK